MNELRTAPSTVLRNSVRGIRIAWTFTPPALRERLEVSTFLSSIVTSAKSMSDFAQTVSCERLPHRIAARMDRSSLTCATRSPSASLNFCWMDPLEVLTVPCPFGSNAARLLAPHMPRPQHAADPLDERFGDYNLDLQAAIVRNTPPVDRC